LDFFFHFLKFFILLVLPFQGLPVFAIGVGLSTFDKASVSLIIGKNENGCCLCEALSVCFS